MATGDQTKKLPLFPLVSLLCFASIFFVLSFSRRPPLSHQTFQLKPNLISDPTSPPESCDYTQGSWVYDPNWSSDRYDSTCKELFKGWNCIANNKSNAREIVKWRWQPNGCNLPPFDPVRFLETYRDTKIGFIGDSLNRNMFVSLFCTLKRVSSAVKKWRPAGADRGFTFTDYNLTIAYHRTNLLARYDGLLMLMVESWNLLDIKRVIELMWTFQTAHGQMLPTSMIF
ncbi:hypothetical protein JCGZ_09876 [Jatropha curcas]|uniref:Uncharacterized protein n=1 Tax=Jatropha curcas TaxID=180498 RepID=A0A067KVL6_JATCU|nr:hypothetical protein JCGZ_09876 [Jatropha curcas]